MGRAIAAGIAIGAAAAAASCFWKPDRPSGTDGDGGLGDANKLDAGPDDASIDAPDDALDGCGVHDDFDAQAGAPCGTWGTATTATALSRKGSLLVVAPSVPGAQAYCETTATFKFDAGASIEILQAMASPYGDRTFVSLILTDAPPVTLALVGDGSGSGGTGSEKTFVDVYCNGAGGPVRSYEPAADRWVRFTGNLETSATKIVLETGSNGTTWTYLADCTVAEVVQTVKLRMGAGRGSGTNTITETHFDNFNIKTCPPL